MTTGRITAAHAWFNGIRQTIPWAHPCQKRKRHLDQFSRFCIARRRVSLYFTMGCPSTSKIAPSHGGSKNPSNIPFYKSSAVAEMATIDMGRKEGSCCVPFAGGAGSPSNTMWPGGLPACTPSFILIRPTVWPRYTNVTDRQADGTDRTTVR